MGSGFTVAPHGDLAWTGLAVMALVINKYCALGESSSVMILDCLKMREDINNRNLEYIMLLCWHRLTGVLSISLHA